MGKEERNLKIATVIGKLEPRRNAPGLEDARWIQLRIGKQMMVAADPVGAEPGQLVLVATGAAAGHYRMDLCTDALVVAVLEDNNG